MLSAQTSPPVALSFLSLISLFFLFLHLPIYYLLTFELLVLERHSEVPPREHGNESNKVAFES